MHIYKWSEAETLSKDKFISEDPQNGYQRGKSIYGADSQAVPRKQELLLNGGLQIKKGTCSQKWKASPEMSTGSESTRNKNIYIKLLILKIPNHSDNIFKHSILFV